MCSMIGRPATGTSGLGIRLVGGARRGPAPPAPGTGGWATRLVSGRRRAPPPPAMTTAFISLPPLPSYVLLPELDELAHDLLWTWQPRIENFFRTLDPELWESTRQNPVLLLKQLGGEGIARACERDEGKAALEGARAARREYYEAHPR